MLKKNSENNRKVEIVLITPTPDGVIPTGWGDLLKSRCTQRVNMKKRLGKE